MDSTNILDKSSLQALSKKEFTARHSASVPIYEHIMG